MLFCDVWRAMCVVCCVLCVGWCSSLVVCVCSVGVVVVRVVLFSVDSCSCYG